MYPKRFAHDALSFIIEDPRRYMLGSLVNPTGTSSKLVSAASPYWSEDEVAQFEAAVAAYRPAAPPDKTKAADRRNWTRSIRRIKLDVLRALPKHRLTAAMRRHVQEEERLFPHNITGARFTEAQVIGSLMGASEIARASDEDVINAFRTVPDASGWDHPRRSMIGGNIQLSREFATFAKENVARASRLLKAFEPQYGTRAAGYALDALSEVAAPEVVLGLLRDLVGRGFDSEEFRDSASRAIERLVGREATINDDIIALLEGWLTAPLPRGTSDDEALDEGDIDTGVQATGDQHAQSNSRSLLWGQGGLSFVPGGDYLILEALTQIRLSRSESDQLDATLRAYLEQGRDPKIWDNLLQSLAYLHPTDYARRASFLEQVLIKVPALVGSTEAARLLAQAHWWDEKFADSQLDPWRDARSPIVRQAYGEIVAVAAVTQPALTWAQTRLEALVEDRTLTDARTGAALTAAHLWNHQEQRSVAAVLLSSLIAGGGAGVWMAAFEVFRVVDELTPDPATVSFLTVIAERLSDAPQLDATFVVERLAGLLPHQAVLVGRLAVGLIAAWRQDLGNMQTATAAAAPQLVDLAVTLHRLGPETREIGTTLFEKLIDVDAWMARQTLDEIDNRFRERAPSPRPRLARRRVTHGRRTLRAGRS
jgi:hypothetical protein